MFGGEVIHFLAQGQKPTGERKMIKKTWVKSIEQLPSQAGNGVFELEYHGGKIDKISVPSYWITYKNGKRND